MQENQTQLDETAVAEPPPLPDEGEAPRRRTRGGVPWMTAAAIAVSLIGGSIFCYLIQQSSDTASAGSSAAVAPSTGSRPGVDLNRQHWPASFDATAPARGPRLESAMVLRPVLTDMELLHNSYRDQLQQVRRAELACPALRPQFQQVQFAFDAKYQRPLDQISALLTEWKLAVATPPAAIGAQAEMGLDAAGVLLNKVRKADSDLTPRQKELLLAFDPAYLANPAQEYLDGHLHQYNSERAVHGVALHLKYPASWLASEPGGRTVRLLRDRRCMLNMISLRIDDLPRAGITSPRELDDLLDLGDIRQGAPDAKLDAAGIVDLPKAHEALWREFRFTRTLDGRSYRLRAADFAVIRGDRYVSIGFTAGAPASADSSELDAAFARNAPLFRLIVSGMEIED